MRNPFRGWRATAGGAVLAPLLGAVALAGSGAGYMLKMPGQSYPGALPAPTAEEKLLAQRLHAHVERLARSERNTSRPADLEAAAEYLETTLSGFGLSVREQAFMADGVRVRNLEVSIPPRAPRLQAPPVLVVGAHYDSARGTPGANDNASGCAALLELARGLHNAPPVHGHEIRLVLFVNEEAPYFGTGEMGSLVHARELRKRGEKVTGMLSLETMGYYAQQKGSQRYPKPLDRIYPDTGNFLGFVADLGSRDLLHRVIQAFRGHASLPSEGVAAPASLRGVDWSDHWAYRQAGFPALMVTDTAFYRYPYYHTPEDTADKLDYERLALAVRGLELSLRAMTAAD
ncbi:MAG TPA: M28 family peptidase [Noviherbaspirillum sp.]|uniref:M28 family peptidase n=1 Tax=Noviherbaspirillum sp. TaxID=1926288 RepID=UPI002F92267C